MLGRPDANFSLSGLKTAVRNEATRMMPLEPQDVSDLCAGFQAAVLESTADRLNVGLRLFHERFGAPRALATLLQRVGHQLRHRRGLVVGVDATADRDHIGFIGTGTHLVPARSCLCQVTRIRLSPLASQV